MEASASIRAWPAAWQSIASSHISTRPRVSLEQSLRMRRRAQVGHSSVRWQARGAQSEQHRLTQIYADSQSQPYMKHDLRKSAQSTDGLFDARLVQGAHRPLWPEMRNGTLRLPDRPPRAAQRIGRGKLGMARRF